MSVFPQVILPLHTYLNIGGTWTDVSTYTYQRDGTVRPVITRGRADQQASASAQTLAMQLNNRDGRFSPRNPTGPYYGSLPVRNCPVRIGVVTPNTYLRLADDFTSNCQATSLNLVANIEVRWFGRLDHHGPCLLASTWTGTSRSWALALNADGTLTFAWSTTGSDIHSVTSTPGLPIPLGSVMVRCNVNTTSQVITFSVGSVMGAGTQWGATAAGPSAIFGSAAAKMAVGASATFASDFPGYGGCTGQVYEFQLYSVITLVADPIFTSGTAGTNSFSDAQANSWACTGSAEISATSYRFHGEIAGLPQNWDVSGTDVWAPLSCAGMLRRIQQQTKAVLSSTRRAIPSLSGVVAYWPMEDPSSSTQFASGLPTGAGYPMQVVSGSPNFAADTSFNCSAALMQDNNAQLLGPVAKYTDTGTLVIRGLLNIPSGIAGQMLLATVNLNGPTSQLQILWSPSGGIQGFNLIGPGGTISVLNTPIGQPFMFSIEMVESGGNITLTCRVMTVAGVVTTATTSAAGASIGVVTSVEIAPTTAGGVQYTIHPGLSVLGHWYLQTSLTPFSAMAPALAAHAGETAGNRFIRLCQENSLGYRVYGYPALSAAMGPQTVATLMTLLQECETADMGVIYESRNAVALGYRTLKSLTSQGGANNPAVTLSYTAAHLGDGPSAVITPIDDDTYLRNDVTVQRGSATGASSAAGSSYTAVLNDGSPMSISPPPAGAGDYQTQVTANVAADTQARDVAGWQLHLGTSNEERYPVIPLQLARAELASLIWTIAAMDIGDYLQITSPPAWLPPGPVKLLMLGYQEPLGGYIWSLALNCVPETPFEVGITGDAVYGHVQTDGSSLAAGCTNSATSLSVASAGIVWTQAAGDFPFDVIIGGERMTVTNITGAASPQTFTVTRSVNGVVKAHLSGEAVALMFPAVLAIA